MKRACNWIPFKPEHTIDAARLLAAIRNKAIEQAAVLPDFAETEATKILESELAKDVSGAFLLTEGTDLLGYAIATVTDDKVWGRCGWLNPGAFAVRAGYEDSLSDLYTLVGRGWLKRGILDHRLFTFAPNGNMPEAWLNLGFSKQQTYAVLDPASLPPETDFAKRDEILVRPARSVDADEISTFSRCIASYQAEGPCFAPVPEEYMKALDQGFTNLTEDDEAEILVAETEGKLAGLAVLYPANHPGLLVPGAGVELSVGAVKPEYRGTGVGTALTRAVFADQQRRGRSCIATDWRCANPLSSRFWPKMGFRSIGHRLVRRLDPLCLSGT